jgi:arylsulfatase A-like enzyme
MFRTLRTFTAAFLCGIAHSKPPNIVFFLVDDLGQRDVGCYGSQFYETPAIDQLAKEGILFNNAYSTCHVCSPSRASILTGKYPARTNLTEWLAGRPERNKDKPFFVHLEHFSVHDPIQGRKDLVQKYQKKLATMPHQEGPDFILEPNPDGPEISEDQLKALHENDDSTTNQSERVW